MMKRFLIEFILVNCKNDSPTEPEDTSSEQTQKIRFWVSLLLPLYSLQTLTTYQQGQRKHSTLQQI